MRKLFFAAVTALMFAMLSVSAFATISLTYDVEEVSTTAGTAYKVSATLGDDQGDFRGFKNDITFDYSMIKPVNKTSGAAIDIATSTTNKASLGRYTCTYYDEDEGSDVTVTASWADVQWTVDGDSANLIYEVYVTPNNYPSDGYVVFEMTFMFADGYTLDDLQPNSFVIDYVAYRNGHDGGHYYNSTTDGQTNDIILTNNVVPEETVITIPVQAGDKIYLQDGTVATAAEDGDYQVLNTVDYVAVNTGKTAQKTYYVDGKTATLVHTNGIVSTEGNNLRGPDETSSVATNTSGLRFLMNHNPENRTTAGHEITEIGVLMTVESKKVLGVIDQTTIDNLKVADVDTGAVLSGYALGNGYDKAFNTEDDNNWIISAVMYNIKITEGNVKTNIVCRPFYKVGDTYIYGETMKATLYDVATVIAEGEYLGCSDELRAYVDEIIAAVPDDTEIELGEVIINISGLYGTN